MAPPLLSEEEVTQIAASIKDSADDGWGEVSDALLGTWRRNPNRGARILRDYLKDGSNRVRSLRVLVYLSAMAFRNGEIGNEQTDAIRRFCERNYRRGQMP